MPNGPSLDGVGGGGFGGGGGGELSARIRLSPAGPFNFGNILVAGTGNIVVTIYNDGTSSLTVSSITISGTGFSRSGITLPKTIAAGGSTTFTLSFTPAATGPYSGTVSIVHNGTNVASPIVKGLSGTGYIAGTGTGIISFNPISLSFPDTKVGKTSAEMSVEVCNIGDAPFTIMDITLVTGTDFTIIVKPEGFSHPEVSPRMKMTQRPLYAGVCALPNWPGKLLQREQTRVSWAASGRRAALSPLQLPPGACSTVKVVFNPTITGNRQDLLRFQTSLGSSPYDVPLDGIGVLLIPIAIVDSSVRQTLFAFMTSEGAVAHFSLDPTNLNGDEDSLIIFQNRSWGAPGQEKSLMRVEVFYENVGVGEITVKAKAYRPRGGVDNFQTEFERITLGTAAADKSVRSQFANIRISGELIELRIERAAASGPVSILAVIPQFAPRGEKVGNV